MSNLKTEKWAGHEIRFVEKEKGEWWAIAVDVCKVLDLANATRALSRLELEDKGLTTSKGLNRSNEPVNIISEFGIYKLVLTSKKPQARAFERWVFSILKELRKSVGLEGFEVFRMLDKEHQKEAMRKLSEGLNSSKPINFIKANTISNKAVSNLYGHKKMIKKDDMSPEMLEHRVPILDDVVDLMQAKERHKLELSVSKTIYKKYKN